MKEDQIDVIELLATHEEAISQLYTCYAERFPDHKEFWSTLSEEELEHAKLVRQLRELSVKYDETKLRIPVIKISLDRVEYQLAKVHKETVSLINALSTALDLERSIMDGKIFQAFKGYSTDAKGVLQELESTLHDHVERIQKAWNEHRTFS